MGTDELSQKPDEMLGGYLCWTSIPSRGSSNTPLESLNATDTRISSGSVGHFNLRSGVCRLNLFTTLNN